MKRCWVFFFVIWGTLAGAVSALGQEPAETGLNLVETTIQDVYELSVEELLDIEIVSVSNAAEKMSQAPARVLVVTGEEILERGYSNLLDIFADLPSIDLAITYGDLYYKAYWRGYRKDASSFLFMIDGRTMNHLWFNRTDMLATVSLTNIERVEVVYGPASAVYGPNAMMGVFNVITKKSYGSEDSDLGAKANFTVGSYEERRADLSMGYNKDDFSLQLTGTMHNSNMDEGSLGGYMYTDPNIANDRNLWGGGLDIDQFGGAIKAGTFRSFMVSSSYKELEVGMAYFDKASGYGTNYAYDKNNPRGWWREPDVDVYAKNSIALSDEVTSHSMIRFRRSDVTNDNISMEGHPEGPMDAATGKRVAGRHILIQYWQSLNSAWYVQQDFDIVPTEDLVLKTGINFEDRDIQKAYDFGDTTRVPPGDYSLSDAGQSSIATHRFENRLRWVNMGAFAQVRYDVGRFFNSSDHLVNFGVRYHNNSLYGGSVTLRGGYVGDLDFINLKLLGGQSFQEPSAKQLFGAWAGSGTNTNLLPEKSATIEAVVDWASENLSLSLNPYYVMVSDLITEAGGSAANVGSRTIMGADVFIRGAMDLGDIATLRGWVNYGFTSAKEQEVEGAKEVDVGDISPHKINFGLTTVMFEGDISLNLRGRYVHERKTVVSNPLGTIAGFFTADANLKFKNLGVDGVGLSLTLKNILDTMYNHPGIRGANASNTGQGVTGEFNYSQPSNKWSSSALPQPGRSFMASLHLDI